MSAFDVSALQPSLFCFILLFCRIGSMILALPGFSESYVPMQSRLGIALLLAFLLTPVLSRAMPPLPPSALSLLLLIVSEILVGLFLGAIAQLLISAVHLAGMIFSFQSGLSSAVIYDASQRSQGSVVGTFFSITVIVLMFITQLDALLLRGLAHSYTLFLPGHFPPFKDFVEHFTRFFGDIFLIALQITSPFLVGGTLLVLGGGILARLMPTIQIFFLITVPQMLINFFVLIAVFSAMLLWYMDFFRDHLERILGG